MSLHKYIKNTQFPQKICQLTKLPLAVNPDVLYALGDGAIEEEDDFGFPPNE